MRRREFLSAVSGAMIALPLAVQAQQHAMPVIGYLSGGAPGPLAPFASAFREGLGESGYVEGQNVGIEYRWAEFHFDRLPSLAADLVGRKVDLIAAGGGDLAARAAKNATATIPIVCTSGDDPVVTGLVASLARPGGNLTGVSFLVVELHAKRLEILSELVPRAKIFGLLVNPTNPQTERVVRAMQDAARLKGVQLEIATAATESDIDAAFASLAGLNVDALVEQSDPFFVGRREQFAALAARYAMPAIYEGRSFPETGGLISYGSSLPAVYRQIGVYAGKILRGAKPADLPVMQPTKFELVVNLKAAKSIGMTIPESFLLRVDEVIE
jgi:putative ABC transport system substrate-binding protein